MSKDTEELSALQEFGSGRPYPVLRVNCASWQPKAAARALDTAGCCQKWVTDLVCQPAGCGRLRGAFHSSSDVKPGAAA